MSRALVIPLRVRVIDHKGTDVAIHFNGKLDTSEILIPGCETIGGHRVQNGANINGADEHIAGS